MDPWGSSDSIELEVCCMIPPPTHPNHDTVESWERGWMRESCLNPMRNECAGMTRLCDVIVGSHAVSQWKWMTKCPDLCLFNFALSQLVCFSCEVICSGHIFNYITVFLSYLMYYIYTDIASLNYPYTQHCVTVNKIIHGKQINQIPIVHFYTVKINT